jgi:tRNA pseudouridine32 synthase/23S rRNA pseudouridine746 synthase
LLLHAQELAFVHPFTEQALVFQATVHWSATAPYMAAEN